VRSVLRGCSGRERGVCVTCLCVVETETAVSETGLRRLPHGVRESPTSQDAPPPGGPAGRQCMRAARSPFSLQTAEGWRVGPKVCRCRCVSAAVSACVLRALGHNDHGASAPVSPPVSTATLRPLHLHLSVSLLSPPLLRNSDLRISSLCIASADDSGRAVAQRSQTLHISVA
jgi:hypothetical protein